MIETVFDAWVREAEQRLALAGDYPLIDDPQIDMSEELFNHAYRVVKESPGGSSSTPSDIEPAIEFLEVRLIRSKDALQVRFVALNFLYRLAHFTGFASKSSAPEIHGAVWPHLERFVRLQEVSVIEDSRATRWEITNAGVIQDWDRTFALLDRLKSLGAITASEWRALRGQVYVCSVVAPRNEAEDEGEEGLLGKDVTDWWVPRIDRVYGLSARTLGLLSWGMRPMDNAYSDEERERLSDAAHEWDACFGETFDLLGAYRAAWGKCHFLSGDYLRAAKQFEKLLADGLRQPIEAALEIRLDAYLKLAESLREGGEIEAAIRCLEKCVQEFPTTAGLWLKLARLYLSSPLDLDPQKVLECLRKEEEIDPSFGDDPRTSIAFTLAEFGGTGIQAALRRFAESNPENLRVINELLSRHWAFFQSLDEASREQWVTAAAFLWGGSPHLRVLRRKVVGVFADIAEDELGRLFDRYRKERGPAVLQGIPPASGKDRFVKYLEGSHLGLGEMIFEIEATRRLPEPIYPDLKSWLQRNAPRLMHTWSPSRTRRLNELRRQCAHPGGQVSEQEASELYDLSAWLVSQLVAN